MSPKRRHHCFRGSRKCTSPTGTCSFQYTWSRQRRGSADFTTWPKGTAHTCVSYDFETFCFSGVDIVALLESWNISERITNPLKDSSMGYLALAYALYKIATPARYTVTLGGTTISINYLRKWGYIKPVPSKERLKEMYLEQKDNLLETVRETREGLKMQSEKLKDKKENIIEDFDKGIKQIKELGEKIKSKESVVEVNKKVKKPKDKN
jgi:hypothetical protein